VIKLEKIVPQYDERDNYNPKGRDVNPMFAAGWNAAVDTLTIEQSVNLAARIKAAIRKLPAKTLPGETNYNEGTTIVELKAVLKAIDETRARFDGSGRRNS
jgi:hypothetical protein